MNISEIDEKILKDLGKLFIAIRFFENSPSYDRLSQNLPLLRKVTGLKDEDIKEAIGTIQKFNLEKSFEPKNRKEMGFYKKSDES